MSRRRAGTFSDVQYQKLDQADTGFLDTQFQSHSTGQRIPWKAILLATLLFFGGTLMLIIGSLIVSGHINTKVSKLLLVI